MHFYSCPLPDKSLPQVLIITGRGKLLILPRLRFFENLSPQQKGGEGKESVKIHHGITAFKVDGIV